jgi:ATP-dependent DNA ligase
MSVHHAFPILYGIEKNGKIKSWKAWVSIEGAFAISYIEYGQLDGKKQTNMRQYTEGKNIGKKNETSPLQQCMAETEKKWKDKQEKESYTTSINLGKSEQYSETHPQTTAEEELPLKTKKIFPMLAHKYERNTTKNKKNNIVFPCYVQPKLDGLRCVFYLIDGKVRAQSRTGTYFDTMEHICESLFPLFNNNPQLVLDGELYTDAIPFEELAGLIKKKKISTDDKLRLKMVSYHVYDIINTYTYDKRYEQLCSLLQTHVNHIELVETKIVHNQDEFYLAFSEYIDAGYEGIMLRNTHGLYVENYRSHDLQKYKEFIEDEYPIIGYKEADGRDKGTVIWICKNKDGREFSVRPKGSLEYRRQLFLNAESYINKQLTVIFQELSEQQVPRFPVGKAIRDNY